METGSVPGDLPISDGGEVRISSRNGEVEAAPAGAVPIDLTGHITVETPGYFVANTVGRIVNVVV